MNPRDRLVWMKIDALIELKCDDAHKIRELLETARGKGSMHYVIADTITDITEDEE